MNLAWLTTLAMFAGPMLFILAIVLWITDTRTTTLERRLRRVESQLELDDTDVEP